MTNEGGAHTVSPVLQRLLRPVLRTWGAYARDDLAPRPDDTPRVHAPGIGLDRLLVIGSGVAVGWGVRSHDLALPGALARSLAVRTGRGVDVDVTADPELTARSAPRALLERRLADYDAFIVSLGLNEALALESLPVWRRSVVQVIDTLRSHAATRSRIFLLGIPPVRAFEFYDSPAGTIASAHARRLNRAMLEVSRVTPGVTFIPLVTPPDAERRHLDRTRYSAWGDAIAETIAPLMFLDRVARPGHAHSSLDEQRRQAAVDALGLAEGSERLDRIVALAARLFGAQAAAFSIVDRDHVWFRATAGSASGTTPREDAFCSTTITGRGALVVPDARVDSRFSSSSIVAGPPAVRFYAGYPVLSPTGEPIGALCVFDARPRSSDDVDLELLRRLASMVEAELAALEPRKRVRR